MIGNRRNRIRCGVIFTALLLIAALLFAAQYFNIFHNKTYSAEDFGIKTEKSAVDFNKNGTDDYTDIMLGARKDAENEPRYDGSYYEGGYPPDDIGVCTDVVWRAFKNAGYDLKRMVDKDISERAEDYTEIREADPNIDFRRVRNLHVFFEKYAVSLTCDKEKIEEWQAGDIVIFGEDRHIGIVSDKRNSNGQTYIIHNGGQPKREEDYLKRGKITAHYRFDASKIEVEALVPWE